MTFVVDPISRMRMHPGATLSSDVKKNRYNTAVLYCYDLTRKIEKKKKKITTFGPLL